jgi:hypothetical protein
MINLLSLVMKKNKSKIISLFSLSLLALLQTACGSGCDDALDVDAIALDDKYIINYSKDVSEGKIDPSIKAYALTKRGVIDSGKPFDNDHNTMDEITASLDALSGNMPQAGNLSNDLKGTPNDHFVVIKKAFANATDSSANASTLQGDVKALAEKKYPAGGAATPLKTFLETPCPSTLSQELLQKCKNTKELLNELLENLYAKSSFLTLELYGQQLRDKIDELATQISSLKDALLLSPTAAAALTDLTKLEINHDALSASASKIKQSSLLSPSLTTIIGNMVTESNALKTTIGTFAPALKASFDGQADSIINNINSINTWLATFASSEQKIKDPALASPEFKIFITKVFSKAPALVLAKNVEIDGDTDVENVKKFFEGSSKQKLFIKDDDASSTNFSLGLAAAIHNDQRSNLGNVYAFNVPNILNAAKDYGIELKDDVEKFVISIIRRSSAEIAAKSANNIIFVIKTDDFTTIDTNKVLEALENNSNILIFASNSAQEALGAAGASISNYYLAGLSAPEAFIAAQAKAQSLNAARASKLSPVAVNIVADTTAKLLAGLGTKKVTLKAVSDAVNNTFSSLNGTNLSDETVKQKVITALAFNTAEVNNSGVLKAELKAVQNLGAPYFQAQAKKGEDNRLYKAAKNAQNATILAATKKEEQAKEDKKASQAKIGELDTEWANYQTAVQARLDGLDINQAVLDYQTQIEAARVYANNVLNSMEAMANDNKLCLVDLDIEVRLGGSDKLHKRDTGWTRDFSQAFDLTPDGKVTLKTTVKTPISIDEQKKQNALITNCFLGKHTVSATMIEQRKLLEKIKLVRKSINKVSSDLFDSSLKFLTKADNNIVTATSLTMKSFSSDNSLFDFSSISFPSKDKLNDYLASANDVPEGQNKRLWAWFLAQIYGKIEDNGVIPDSEDDLWGINNLYQPNNLFTKNTVFVERIKTATAEFEEKAKVYLAAQYGLKIVGEYYNMLKALYDKNTVAEIDAQRAIANVALVSLFDDMRTVIRDADATDLVVPVVGQTLADTVGYYYDVLNTNNAMTVGFCGAHPLVKLAANIATLKTLKIDGDVAKSTTEICKYRALLRKTF